MEESREVVRCQKCNLNQFVTHSGCCRRCGATFPKVESLLDVEDPIPKMCSSGRFGKFFGIRLRQIRREILCITQGELSVARSYISRIESGRCPKLSIFVLERLSDSTGIPMRLFVSEERLDPLLYDPWIKQIVEALKIFRPSKEYLEKVLDSVRRLANDRESQRECGRLYMNCGKRLYESHEKVTTSVTTETI